MALVVLLAIVVLKQYICRFRNSHEPDQGAVDMFLNGDGTELKTTCLTCECDLALRWDPDEPDLYWVIEI